MRFIPHAFSLVHVGLYFAYKLPTWFIFKNKNLEPMRMHRRCSFQNGGLISNRYESFHY